MALNLIKDNEPHFSQPTRQMLSMLVVLGLVGLIGWLLIPTIAPIFLASPYLNGLILAVFVIGVIACFAQIYALFRSVGWIEGFALDRPGHEFVTVPRLLLPLAALLGGNKARHGLNSYSARSILDSVGQRLDEARDITRYITNLLIFLGLLGTFYGLATTVPAVVDTIRSLEPTPGSGQSIDFSRLMAGLEDQLGGMGTAFASSLLGLAGSLVVGLLELFAGHGQNRFYMELEEWLSTITRIGFGNGDGGQPDAESGMFETMIDHTALQIDSLREMFAKAEERRAESDARLDRLVGLLERQADADSALPEGTLVRLAQTHERTADALETLAADGLQSDATARLRDIDTHLLRILEEIGQGRQDSTAEIRAELARLTDTIKDRTGG